MWTALLFFLSLPLFPVSAQTPPPAHESEKYVSAYLMVQENGNVSVDINTLEFPAADAARLQDEVPRSLGCQWRTTRQSKYTLVGVCRAWLSPHQRNLDLAPLARSVYHAGAKSVYLNVSFFAELPQTPPLAWVPSQSTRKPGAKIRSVEFESHQTGELPPPLLAPQIIFFDPARELLLPVLLVLIAPVGMAWIVRKRSSEATADKKVNWIVWMSWIELATMLYWLSSIRTSSIAEFAYTVGFRHPLAALPFGLILLVGPPLLALAASLYVIDPLLSSSRQSLRIIIWKRVIDQSVWFVPIAICIVTVGVGGQSSYHYGGGLFAALAAYGLLGWYDWTLSFGNSTPIESGPLYDTVISLSTKAGVPISRIQLIRTRIPEEANAFAASDGSIYLTESLVQSLPPRETAATVAHEVGHHKGGHLSGFGPLPLLLGFVFLAEPAWGWLCRQCHLPFWCVMLPVPMLGFLALQGMLSQRKEYEADARAVDLTGDVEGMVAALGRLAKISRIPAQSAGIMGSILSHPSMEARVLALAHRFDLPSDRALAILRDPDAAYPPGEARPEPLPIAPVSDAPILAPVYGTLARRAFREQMSWIYLLVPPLALALFAATIAIFTGRRSVVLLWTLVATAPVALWLTCRAELLWSTRFAARIRRKLTERLQPPQHALFVGIHPGKGLRYTEGVSEWDFGFLTFGGDWLTYRGETACFSIPRCAIAAVDVISSPPAWLREHRVQITLDNGLAFVVNPDFCGERKWQSRRLAEWLQDWMTEPLTDIPSQPQPLPAPEFPSLPGTDIPRSAAIGGAIVSSGISLFASLLLCLPLYGWIPATSAIPFLAALITLASAVPSIIWPLRRPQDEPPPQAAPVPMKVPTPAAGG